MSKRLASTKKFQFFDIIEGEEFLKPNSNIKQIDEEEKKKNNYPEVLMSRTLPDQMFAMDGIVFLCGKIAKSYKDGFMREQLVIKVVNNVVIDEYKLYNKICYNFQLKTFNDQPYFVTIGGDFDLHKIEGEDQYLLVTSIRIFDATTIIQNPRTRVKDDMELKQFKRRELKLLRHINQNTFFIGNQIPRGVESFQNILSFAINTDFSKIAVGLDKGQIILISGTPNIIECSDKFLTIKFLEQIEEELHITNLAFAINDLGIEILYATTAKAIYVYILGDEGENEEVEELSPPESDAGAYSGCIAVENETNSLIVASNSTSEEAFIVEYVNLERGASWFFEGRKSNIGYFKKYLMFVISDDKKSSIVVFDKVNKFFVYYNDSLPRISNLCADNEHIYAFVNDIANTKNFILRLEEKDNKDKFDTFYNKKYFDIAYEYAKSLKYDQRKISEISKKHAEYCYKQKEYDKSIEQFILTINYLDPSSVIQKFLEKSKLDYLIQYLEALLKDEEFKKRDKDELKDYTTLLLNCYIMQEKFAKLKEFIDKGGKDFPIQDVQTAIDVCLENNNTELALIIAEKNDMNDEYLRILINVQKKFKEGLNYIKNESSIEKKFNMLCNYGEIFIRENKEKKQQQKEDSNQNLNQSQIQKQNKRQEKNQAEEVFEMAKKFIEYKVKNPKKEEAEKMDYNKIIKIFMEDDMYYENILDFILKLDPSCDNTIIHRRIEQYLQKDDPSERKKIINMLRDENYEKRVDKVYLWLLFQVKNYKEGITELSKKLNLKRVLLTIYMESNSFEKILKFCEEEQDNSFWLLALRYFNEVSEVDDNEFKEMDNEEIKKINEEKKEYLKIVLNKLLVNDNISPLEVLEILKLNKDVPFETFRPFIEKVMDPEYKGIGKEQSSYEKENEELININEEIKKMKTSSLKIRPNKCEACNGTLTLPTLHFLCHHSFHFLCLNEKNTKEAECPSCKLERERLNESIKKKEEEGKNYAKIKEEINKSEGKKFEEVIKKISGGYFKLKDKK